MPEGFVCCVGSLLLLFTTDLETLPREASKPLQWSHGLACMNDFNNESALRMKVSSCLQKRVSTQFFALEIPCGKGWLHYFYEANHVMVHGSLTTLKLLTTLNTK